MKKSLLFVGSVSVLCLLSAVGVSLSLLGRNRSAEQPIAFSHRIHVKENEIECLNCHEYYERYAVAGMPRIQNCIDCHEAVESRPKEVKKLFEFWEKRQEIPWIRLYQLPKHVVFSHKPHLRAGVTCASCHGEIATSDEARLELKPTMRRCMECHRIKAVSNDCLTCHK